MTFHQKKRKRNSTTNYSNTKVKARNLLTNVSYKRFKQSDFNTFSFIVDILSFLVQKVNPINLDRKLDNEKEKDISKFTWGECIPNVFIGYMYSKENYDVISDPKLTYQKANKIVENFIMKDPNYINLLKCKMEEKFYFIHYVYSSLYPKIYNRIVHLGIQKKSNFDFSFQNWRLRKNNEPIGHKIIEELPAPTNQLLIPDVLSKGKRPKDYKDREANENEQVPINIKQKIPPPTLPKILPQKRDLSKDRAESKKTDYNTAKNAMDYRVAKKRAERKEMLQRQLSANTAKMNLIKKAKNQ